MSPCIPVSLSHALHRFSFVHKRRPAMSIDTKQKLKLALLTATANDWNQPFIHPFIRSSVHLSNCPSVFTWVSVYVFCCRFPYASCACLYIAAFANLCLAVLLFLVLGWVDLTLFQALLHRPICLCVCFLLLCYMWQSCTPMDETHVTTLRERERHSDSRKGRDIIETETETDMGACLRSGRLTL